MTQAIEASQREQCPLCGKPDYCYLIPNHTGEFTKVICGRTQPENAPAGWDYSGPAKDHRPLFTKTGTHARKRRSFPNEISLQPEEKGDIPAWVPVEIPLEQINTGHRVILKPGVMGNPDSIYTVTKLERRAKGEAREWYLTLDGSIQIYESSVLAIATHDPATGAQESQIEYHYPAVDGTPLGKVIRKQWSDRRPWYDKNRSKSIRPAYWVGSPADGHWSEKGKGDRPWPLYREKEAKEAIAAGEPLFVCAGEQAVETYRSLGLTATTCQGGEANFKEIVNRLIDDFAEAKRQQIRSFLVIHPDHDLTGETKFSDLLQSCTLAKIPAVMIEPLSLWAKMPVGGDIYDYVQQSGELPDAIIQQLENCIDSAIDQAEQEIDARKQRDRWGAPESYHGELGYWKECDEDMRIFQPKTDFDFQIERELVSEAGGGFILQVKLRDERRQYRVMLKSKDYSTPQGFEDALKKALGRPVVCTLSPNATKALFVTRMHEYRITRRGKAFRLIDRIGQQRDGKWVFHNCQFDRNGNPTSETETLWVWNDELNDGENSFKSPAISSPNPEALPQLVATMQRAFGPANFYPALMTLGYAAAGVHYQEIQAVEGAFPILNLYGDPGSGKTSAADCALSLVGQHGEDRGAMAEVSVSAAYERLKLAGGLLHCLDDPKRDPLLDEFLKGFYNGKGRVVRGGKDNEGFNNQKPHSPLMVTSNHACGENSAATQSRLIRIYFAKRKDGDPVAFRELQQCQRLASGCFPDLIRLGYAADAIHLLEYELAQHLPHAHVRVAKSLSLLLHYTMEVARLARIPAEPVKQYVIREICSQVNDPNESGDSLRDFFEKIHVLLSESKIGDWNYRQIEKDDTSKVFALYLPGVWAAFDKQFKVIYNRKTIESLLQERGAIYTRQRFHADEEQSKTYTRLCMSHSEEVPPRVPQNTTRWCFEISEELLREYSSMNSRSTRSTATSEVDESQSPPISELLIPLDQQSINEINSPFEEPIVDLFTPRSLIERSTMPINNSNPIHEQVSPPSEGIVDLVDRKNALSHEWGVESPPAIEIGDVVVANASGYLDRKSSDPYPAGAVPRKVQNLKMIPLEALDGSFFNELTAPSEVVAILQKSGSVRVKNVKTGRLSVFKIGDVNLLKKGGKA